MNVNATNERITRSAIVRPQRRTRRRRPLDPARLRKRERVRALVKRLRKRHHEHPLRKRKTALALSAGAMGLTAGMTAPSAPASTSSGYTVLEPEVRKPAVLLRASESLKEAMIQEEGVREVVYLDVAGYPTVGVGHLVRPKDGLRVGQRVSYDSILDFFEQDMRHAEHAAARLAGDLPLFQHEFDALVDLVFNVGEGNVSEAQSPRLNRAIEHRDYDGIARELTYTTAKGAQADGLVHRSERRSSIFMNARYDDPRARGQQRQHV